MQLSFKIISSPGSLDSRIRDFIAANDNDFYPTIASRRDLADFVQSVYQAKGKYVICFDGEIIVGLTSVYLDHPSFITYYHYIAIDKNYRGKGISTTLYDHVHTICREHGVQWAIVKTWSSNQVSQAMFKKHGFFHLYSIEDDRSKGVHTYFYAKSFSNEKCEKPVRRIAIVGGRNNHSIANFVKTISSIPVITTEPEKELSFIVDVNNPGNLLSNIEESGVSHIINFDDTEVYNNTMYPAIEIIDFAAIIKRLVAERKKRWMPLTKKDSIKWDCFGIDRNHFPAEDGQLRIEEIIDEITTGKISPSYHKKEITDIAMLNDYDGILLGTSELHTMFNFDKMFNGIEIVDPWLELAIIIHNNKVKS